MGELLAIVAILISIGTLFNTHRVPRLETIVPNARGIQSGQSVQGCRCWNGLLGLIFMILLHAELSRRKLRIMRKASAQYGTVNPKFILSVITATCSTFGQVTELFSEGFDNSNSAAARFQYNSGVSFANGLISVPIGNVATLRPGNLMDNGPQQVIYSVTQSVNSPTIAEFRVRGSSDSPYDGYFLSAGNGYIGITRVTDEERAAGVFGTQQGGTMYAPPALSTLGPDKLDLALENHADMVRIRILVNGVEAMVFDDTSSYRITQGDTLGFSIDWGDTASWDNVNVTSIPEPSTFALAIIGFGALGLGRRRCFLVEGR